MSTVDEHRIASLGIAIVLSFVAVILLLVIMVAAFSLAILPRFESFVSDVVFVTLDLLPLVLLCMSPAVASQLLLVIWCRPPKRSDPSAKVSRPETLTARVATPQHFSRETC